MIEIRVPDYRLYELEPMVLRQHLCKPCLAHAIAELDAGREADTCSIPRLARTEENISCPKCGWKWVRFQDGVAYEQLTGEEERNEWWLHSIGYDRERDGLPVPYHRPLSGLEDCSMVCPPCHEDWERKCAAVGGNSDPGLGGPGGFKGELELVNGKLVCRKCGETWGVVLSAEETRARQDKADRARAEKPLLDEMRLDDPGA